MRQGREIPHHLEFPNSRCDCIPEALTPQVTIKPGKESKNRKGPWILLGDLELFFFLFSFFYILVYIDFVNDERESCLKAKIND